MTSPSATQEGIRYVAGGTVQAGGGVYLERPADRELLEHCRRGDFVYILTARQLGKSSLMIRTAEALIEEGCLAVVIDLQSVGTPENAEQWYRGLLLEIESQLDLGVDVAKWWRERDDIGYAHRLGQFLREVVVGSTEQRVVIFVDEIDTTLALGYTDDFFIAIRYLHEVRAQEEALARLSFVLIGVATPSDLIKEGHRTPFNIGSPLEMTDFTAEEAMPLVTGTGTPSEAGEPVLRRVLHWTGGHPYLTLRTFQALHERGAWSEGEVDGCIERLFMGDQTSSDHNIQFVRSMLTDKSPERNRGLELLVAMHRGKTVRDQRLDAAINWLKLSGVVRSEAGSLWVRNAIYERVFSAQWAKDNLAIDWARRFRRLVLGGAAAAVLGFSVLIPWFLQSQETADALWRERLGVAALEAEGMRVKAQRDRAEEAKLVAEQNLRRSDSVRLSALAQSFIEQRYELGGLLAVEAARVRMDAGEPVDGAVLDSLRLFALQGRPLRGHEKTVCSAEWSPDGQRVVTASLDGTVRVWWVDGRGEPLVLRGHEDEVWSAQWSPDGGRIVTTSSDETVRVWSVDGKGESIVLRGHEERVTLAKWSPDGEHVVTCSDDDTARVWRADGSGAPVVLDGFDGEVRAADFSPDGTIVVVAANDATAGAKVFRSDGRGDPVVFHGHDDEGVKTAVFSSDGKHVLSVGANDVHVWRADGKGKPVLLRHGSWVSSAVFSPDGKLVLTASDDKVARIWRADGRGEPVVLRGHDGDVGDARFSPDGTLVVTSSGPDRTARIWRADGRGDPVVLRGHEGDLRMAAFSPDGKQVVTSSHDGTARLWQVDAHGDPIVLRGHEAMVDMAEFSPDGQHVVTASNDHTARVWQASGHGAPVVLRHYGGVISAHWSPDGERIVTALMHREAWVWRADGTGEPIELGDHGFGPFERDRVHSAKWSPDGKLVVTAGEDGTARVWRADGSGEPVVLRGHTDEVFSAAFSPDGTLVVTASDDQTARVWRADGSGEPVVLAGHLNPVYGAMFSPDGRRVLTHTGESRVRVWPVDGIGEPVVLQHDTNGHRAAWSPDGELVVTTSSGGTVRVWRSDGSGEPVVLRGHEAVGSMYGARWSPDGELVVTASQDRTARVWRVDGSGEPVVLRGHEDWVMDASFSPDGRHIVTASRDRTARIWITDPSTLIPHICQGARRNLTAEEWQIYMPHRPYRETCGPYP